MDTEKIVACNQHDCERKITEWNNLGNCQATGEIRVRGKAIQYQTRDCNDGTNEKCSSVEKVRTVPCNGPGSVLSECVCK